MRYVVLFVLCLVLFAGAGKKSYANPWLPDYVPIPQRIKNGLPQIYVYNTGKTPLVVLSSKMPCEIVSGQRSPPADVMRWLGNTAAKVLNETGVLGFDFEIVCSGE